MTSQTCERLFNDSAAQQWHTRRSYYAEVPTGTLDEQSQLVEQVMQFAFDTLGVRHLEVRVVGVDTGSRDGTAARS